MNTRVMTNKIAGYYDRWMSRFGVITIAPIEVVVLSVGIASCTGTDQRETGERVNQSSEQAEDLKAVESKFGREVMDLERRIAALEELIKTLQGEIENNRQLIIEIGSTGRVDAERM